jgi:hypothetical protein
LTAVLFVEKSNVALATKDEHTSLYVASYIAGPWSQSGNSTAEGIMEGNMVLVNPTSGSFSNLKLAMQVDDSEIINASLRLWDSNYTLNTPNSFLQSEHLFADMQSFSTPITSINIGSNQKETISLIFPSPETFQFTNHSLTIYVSQNNFGDIMNGQLLNAPQTVAYLQIVNFSSVESDETTYHQYYNSTLKSNMVTVAYNPNFYQRYHNISKVDYYSDNFGIMHHMGVLDYSYFNVTVFNNNSFPVNSVTLFGQMPYRSGALIDYAMQPSETYLFPASGEPSSYAYVTGYVFDNSIPTSPTSTPTVPEFSSTIMLLLLSVLTFAVAIKYRRIIIRNSTGKAR